MQRESIYLAKLFNGALTAVHESNGMCRCICNRA